VRKSVVGKFDEELKQRDRRMRDMAYGKKRNHLGLIQEHSVPSISRVSGCKDYA
jgi:hypothetical protein